MSCYASVLMLWEDICIAGAGWLTGGGGMHLKLMGNLFYVDDCFKRNAS